MMSADLAALLSRTRLSLGSEKQAQTDLAAALDAAGIEFQRECRLACGGFIDFLVGDVGIEVKLKGQRKMDVWRQLCRYAEHDAVAALILVSNLSMGLPPEIAGKPAYFVSIGRAWL